MGFKTIAELVIAWEMATPRYARKPSKAYRAGHLQGSLDSLDLLKRAHDVIEIDAETLGLSDVIELLTDLEDQIGYIEEQTKDQA